MTIRIARTMRTMRTLRATPALILGSLSAACGGDGGGGLQSTVRDSAGVTIVENGRPALDSRLGWRVGPEATVSIGTAEGDPAYELFRVGGAMRLSDRTDRGRQRGLRGASRVRCRTASTSRRGAVRATVPANSEPWLQSGVAAVAGRLADGQRFRSAAGSPSSPIDGTFGRALRLQGGYQSGGRPAARTGASSRPAVSRRYPSAGSPVHLGDRPAGPGVWDPPRRTGACGGTWARTADRNCTSSTRPRGRRSPAPIPLSRNAFDFVWGDRCRHHHQ